MALALHNEYVLKRGLFLRVLPDAFAGSQRAELFQTVFSQLAAVPRKTGSAERTFLLDLTPSLEELRKNLDQKWRNQLNRAEKNGLSIEEGTEHEDFQVFAGIYRSMRSRKKFDTTVDVDEFACIQKRLPATQRMKIMNCLQQGIPVAGIVCSAMGDSAIYLLGATGENGLNAKGTYLLQWTMIKWLKENGFHYYDLGGIDPEGNPGVYHFKRGLSGRDVFRIGQFNLCKNFLSSVLMQAGDFVRRRRQMSFAGRPAQDLSGACGATHTGIPQ
jgi:lipid II:glycine glycyltransferase (peptidoglycan interpeptide bridge formation enzyme)